MPVGVRGAGYKLGILKEAWTSLFRSRLAANGINPLPFAPQLTKDLFRGSKTDKVAL
jgi:hypothetical protein